MNGPVRLSQDRQLLVLASLAGAPATVFALILLWQGPYSDALRWTVSLALLTVFIGSALALRARVRSPLESLSHVLAALREDDFSIRGRGAVSGDALGAVMREVNALADALHEQRLDAVEATALLRSVTEQIDVALFAFDAGRRLRLVNRTGEQLLGRPAGAILGQTSDALAVDTWLTSTPSLVELAVPGERPGRWEVRRTIIRLGGRPHDLLVLSDVSRPLREEERLAWQRLIRVIGHELGNSLAPIKSIAGSLASMLQSETLPADWRDDMQQGLRVIASRTEALGRFTSAYARLARLPSPTLASTDLPALITRVAALEARVAIDVQPGPPVAVNVDADQIEQLLINLVRNAAEATVEAGSSGQVTIGWVIGPATVTVWIDDNGPGLANTGNLFVPFFTTKPTGSGIGLVLARQIAEAHGGSLLLENRDNTRGARATLTLPL